MKYNGKKILRFAQDDGLTSVLLSLVLVMCLWMALIAPGIALRAEASLEPRAWAVQAIKE